MKALLFWFTVHFPSSSGPKVDLGSWFSSHAGWGCPFTSASAKLSQGRLRHQGWHHPRCSAVGRSCSSIPPRLSCEQAAHSAAAADKEKSSPKVLTRALGSIRGALHSALVSQLSQLSTGFTCLLGNQALFSTVNKSDKFSARLHKPIPCCNLLALTLINSPRRRTTSWTCLKCSWR